MRAHRVLSLGLLASCLGSFAEWGQGAPGEVKKNDDKVKVEAHLSVDKLPSGDKCQILIRLTVQPGWHINANPPEPKEFVATTVTFKGKHGTTLGELKYPKGKPLTMKDFDDPISAYEGKVDIRGVLNVPAVVGGEPVEEMEIAVKYQACNETTCLLPKTVKLTGKLPVAQPGEPVKAINEKLFPPADKK
jgi:DsbC/DsbD-like thiol-disulfide interchange protein